MSDVLECTLRLVYSCLKRGCAYLVQAYGNCLVQAMVDLQLKGICIKYIRHIVHFLTTKRFAKVESDCLTLRMNQDNTSDLMEKHKDWITQLYAFLPKTSERECIFTIGLISELSFVLPFYSYWLRKMYLSNRHMHIEIYRFRVTIVHCTMVTRNL